MRLIFFRSISFAAAISPLRRFELPAAATPLFRWLFDASAPLMH